MKQHLTSFYMKVIILVKPVLAWLGRFLTVTSIVRRVNMDFVIKDRVLASVMPAMLVLIVRNVTVRISKSGHCVYQRLFVPMIAVERDLVIS
jgi:hypothetical protein